MRRLDVGAMPLAEVVRQACAVVEGDGLIIFPTDTVYGIGCAPSSHAAIDRIYGLKGREREKPLALYFASFEAMLAYVPGDARAVALARTFLPGPLTLVVPRPQAVDPYLVGSLATLGLRVPNHDVCNALLASCGPLAATSANLSGAPPYLGTPRNRVESGGETREPLPDADLLLDAGPSPIGIASTVIALTHDGVRLIRPGAIPFAEIVRACA